MFVSRVSLVPTGVLAKRLGTGGERERSRVPTADSGNAGASAHAGPDWAEAIRVDDQPEPAPPPPAAEANPP